MARLQALFDLVQEARDRLVTGGMPATNQYLSSLVDLGTQVRMAMDEREPLEHGFTLRDEQGGVDLALIAESGNSVQIVLAAAPRVHVFFEVWEGRFNVRVYGLEALERDDYAGELVFSAALDQIQQLGVRHADG